MSLLRRLSDWLDLDAGAGTAADPHALDPVREADAIRDAMVASLGRAAGGDHRRLTERIQLAPDVLALWYLRADLQAALCSLAGEERARRLLAPITARFRGLVPLAAWARAVERDEHR